MKTVYSLTSIASIVAVQLLLLLQKTPLSNAFIQQHGQGPAQLSHSLTHSPLIRPSLILDKHHSHNQQQQLNNPFHVSITSRTSPTTSLFMAKIATLDEWILASNGGISGTIKNSPDPSKLKNGKTVTTSKLMSSKFGLLDGDEVTTVSGSQYKLGRKQGSTSSSSSSSTDSSSSSSTATNFRFNTSVSKPAPTPSPTPVVSNIPVISNWSISNGRVVGLLNGKEVETSPLRGSNFFIKEGSTVTTTSGSQYQLGQPVSKSSSTSPSSITPQTQKPNFNGPTINNWLIMQDNRVSGIISGSRNANVKNGKEIETSPIVDNVNSVKEGDVVTTSSGSQYQLGVPSDSQKTMNRLLFSFGGGSSSNKGGSTKSNEDTVPVIDDWFVNRRERISGIISNSPFPNENDGLFVTTKEVATDFAFVVEGFTVTTTDSRMYKLGTPKKGTLRSSSTSSNSGEVLPFGTPTLADWNLDESRDGFRIIGTMQNTNSYEIRNGQLVKTEKIITDPGFLDEGFSIVTVSGDTYKLGKRLKSPRAVPAFTISEVKLRKKITPSIPLSALGRNQIVAGEPILEDWTVTSLGQVSGTITNSDTQDGLVLTTKRSTKPATLLKPGSIVYSMNGAAYALGQKQSSSAKSSRTPRNKAFNSPTRLGLPLINDWSLTAFGGVTGTVSNSVNPDFNDGEILTTSKIMSDIIREGTVVETMNGSMYVLGSRRRDVSTTEIESPDTPIAEGLWAIVGILFVLLNKGMY